MNEVMSWVKFAFFKSVQSTSHHEEWYLLRSSSLARFTPSHCQLISFIMSCSILPICFQLLPRIA